MSIAGYNVVLDDGCKYYFEADSSIRFDRGALELELLHSLVDDNHKALERDIDWDSVKITVEIDTDGVEDEVWRIVTDHLKKAGYAVSKPNYGFLEYRKETDGLRKDERRTMALDCEAVAIDAANRMEKYDEDTYELKLDMGNGKYDLLTIPAKY